MDEKSQDTDRTEHDEVPADAAAETPDEAGTSDEAERDIPHNEDLQDPAGVGTELTHDQFDLGRGSRIN